MSVHGFGVGPRTNNFSNPNRITIQTGRFVESFFLAGVAFSEKAATRNLRNKASWCNRAKLSAGHSRFKHTETTTPSLSSYSLSISGCAHHDDGKRSPLQKKSKDESTGRALFQQLQNIGEHRRYGERATGPGHSRLGLLRSSQCHARNKLQRERNFLSRRFVGCLDSIH